MSVAGTLSRPGAGDSSELDHDLIQGLPPGSRCTSHQLPNGLWLLATEVPGARLARLVGAVKLGYLDEPGDCRGLAHLLEHSLFLGSERWPEAAALSRWVGKHGGRYNAHTGDTATDIHLHLPPEATDEGLARLCDLLMRPRFPPASIAREAGILDAEFQARLADPALHRLTALGQLCRPDHPASFCHAGNRTTLGNDPERLTARLRQLHRHYHPERMALAMLGPQPLDEQLALLEHHATTLSAPSRELATTPPRTWRWAEPGAIAWWPPHSHHLDDGSQLELLWPFPDSLAHSYRSYLAGVAARLADGTLAATLARSTSLAALQASLAPSGTGPALSLRLELGASPPPLSALLGTVHQALAKAQEVLPIAANCRTACTDDSLDQWPREQARRLAGRLADDSHRQVTGGLDALTAWLAPGQCRLLWSPPRAQRNLYDWRTLAETGTRVQRFALPPLEPHHVLSPRTAPVPAVHSPAACSPATVGAPWIHRQGQPHWPGSAGINHCALGWPTGRHDARRLSAWHQATLALAQAAHSQGHSLRLGSDRWGDWLLVSGSASQVQVLAEQAIVAWPGPSSSASQPPLATGLVAQRLLYQLETAPPPAVPAHPPTASQHLSWTSDGLSSHDILLPCHGIIEPAAGQDANGTAPDRNERWLPPQATDHAVMLEVIAQHASPRSRWLLRLLGQCHDAAFQQALRQQQGLGYAAAVRYRESTGWPRLGYVVQSPHADIGALRRAIEAFLSTRAVALSQLTTAALEIQRHGLLARHGPPETYSSALLQIWQRLRQQPLGSSSSSVSEAWLSPWQEETTTLEHLTPHDLAIVAEALASGDLPRRWWYHRPAQAPAK